MSGIDDVDQTRSGWNEPGKPAAFCQNCGKALDQETKRVVGASVYCEPCLAARLAGAPGYPGAGRTQGYVPVNGGVGSVAGVPTPTGEPNPGLAALLGLIPGVGAMYNEQYAKGIVHLVIFAVLVSFSHVTGIFVLFIFGWIAYMSIEAHHTAKARRDGTPLPNPFGFNDIGERLGFGKAWPGAPDVAGVARDAAEAAAAGFGTVQAGFAQRPAGAAPPPPSAANRWTGPAAAESAAAEHAAADPAAAAGASWGAPVDSAAWAYSNAAYRSHPGQGYAQVPGDGYGYGTAPQTAAYGGAYVPPAGFVPPIPPMPPIAVVQSRFPAGALWLIGLGTIFLLGTTGIFRHVSAGILVGSLLIGFAVWLFLRLMTDTGMGLGYDGTAGYQMRLVRALKPSAWLLLFGVLTILNELHWLRWEYSWPWIIILAGVMMLLNRAAYNTAASAVYGAGPGAAPAGEPVPVTPASTPGSSTMPVVPSGPGVTIHTEASAGTDTDLHQGGN